jgi:hypothetical protein
MTAVATPPLGPDLAFLLREPEGLYRAKAKRYLTSHALGDFRKCPMLFKKKRDGLVPDEDRPAYVVGRALHTLVLEGRSRFEEEFAVGGPINPKTGEIYGAATKAFAEWAEAQGRPVLTTAQFDLVESMADSIRNHGIARDILSEGIPEGVVRADYRDFPCQIRMDWYDPHHSVCDVKTCDDLTYFESDSRRYGYAYQMAFYRAVLAQVIGIHMPVFLIGVEKKQPFRCGVWQIVPDTLAQAQRENEAAIERLKRCLATDTWPSGYEECRVFDCI